MRSVTVEHIPPAFFEKINLNHGCILDFYLWSGINSFTECREKHTSLAPLSTELNTKREGKKAGSLRISIQKQSQSLNIFGNKKCLKLFSYKKIKAARMLDSRTDSLVYTVEPQKLFWVLVLS